MQTTSNQPAAPQVPDYEAQRAYRRVAFRQVSGTRTGEARNAKAQGEQRPQGERTK